MTLKYNLMGNNCWCYCFGWFYFQIKNNLKQIFKQSILILFIKIKAWIKIRMRASRFSVVCKSAQCVEYTRNNLQSSCAKTSRYHALSTIVPELEDMPDRDPRFEFEFESVGIPSLEFRVPKSKSISRFSIFFELAEMVKGWGVWRGEEEMKRVSWKKISSKFEIEGGVGVWG